MAPGFNPACVWVALLLLLLPGRAVAAEESFCGERVPVCAAGARGGQARARWLDLPSARKLGAELAAPRWGAAEWSALRGRPWPGKPSGPLAQEAERLEGSLRGMARGADRAQALRRLSGVYEELVGAARAEQAVGVEAARSLVEVASAGVVRASRALLEEGGAGRDEVLFRLGFELELRGQKDEARAVFFEIVQQFPDSVFVTHAYVAFGDHFFEAARGDPEKLGLARLCYERALARGGGGAVRSYARFMLGRALWGQGDAAGARGAFEQSAKEATGGQLQVEARRAFAVAYAAGGDAAGAEAAVAAVTGVGGLAANRRLLEIVGEAFLDGGKLSEASKLYAALAQGATAEQACLYEARRIETAQTAGWLPRSEARSRLLDQLGRLARIERDPCDVATLEAGAAVTARFHLAARGGDVEAARLADELYEALIAAFAGRPALASARVPEDLSPTIAGLRFARGELARTRGDWATCGQVFLDVASKHPTSPEAIAAERGAGECFARVVEASYPAAAPRGGLSPGPADRPFRELTPRERSMLDALERAACSSADGRSLRLAQARVLLDAGRGREAASRLRAAAALSSSSERPEIDALTLEAAGRSAPDDEACVDDAIRLRDASWTAHCAAGKGPARACASLERLDPELAQAKATALLRRAERSPEAKELQERAARLLHEAARRCALDPIERREPASCEHPELLLWSAAEAYSAGRLLMKSIRVRLLLLDPRYRLDRTEQARRSVVVIGKSYEALADHEEAASWYEKYGNEHPSAADAPWALGQAVGLRLVLGQEIEAARGAELLRSAAFRPHAELAAAVSLSVAAHSARRGAWELARKRLEQTWRFLQEHGAVAARVEAHALQGRIRERLGLDGGASYRRAIELWQRSRPEDPAALDALAEARVFEAARAIRRAAAAAPPALPLRPERAALRRYAEGPFASWIKQRRGALDALDDALDAITQHSPPLPARWIAAAEAHRFELWLAHHQTLARGPWAVLSSREPTLAPILAQMLADPVESAEKNATSAGWACVRGSIQQALFSEATLRCERWLQKHADYHPIDASLLPRPGRSGAPPERSPPMLPPAPPDP